MPERTLRFQQKLWQIVNNCRSGAVSWGEFGDSIIFKFSQFKKEYLDRNVNFCKSNKIASFIRQLNLYGFRKLVKSSTGLKKKTQDQHEFQNSYFLKGRKDLLEHVVRNPTTTLAALKARGKSENYTGKKRRRKRRKRQLKRIYELDEYDHSYYGKNDQDDRNLKWKTRQSRVLSKNGEKALKKAKTNSTEEEIAVPTVTSSQSSVENISLLPNQIKMPASMPSFMHNPHNTQNNPFCKNGKLLELLKGIGGFKTVEDIPISAITETMSQIFTKGFQSNLPPSIPHVLNVERVSDESCNIPLKKSAQEITSAQKVISKTYKKLVAEDNLNGGISIIQSNNSASLANKNRIPKKPRKKYRRRKAKSKENDKWCYLTDDFNYRIKNTDSCADSFEEVEEPKIYFKLEDLPEVTAKHVPVNFTDCEMFEEHLELRAASARMKSIPGRSIGCVCNPEIVPSQVFRYM